MRIGTTSVVVGSLLVIAALPAVAGQSTAPNTHIQLAADSDADRGQYTEKAQDDVDQWKQKVHDFGEKAKTTGQQGSAAAKDDLDKAWTKAKVAADGLKTAGADGWQTAKMSFEKAKSDLANTWDKIKPK
jgi:hypothetical protein